MGTRKKGRRGRPPGRIEPGDLVVNLLRPTETGLVIARENKSRNTLSKEWVILYDGAMNVVSEREMKVIEEAK